jgi:hypothetical protein
MNTTWPGAGKPFFALCLAKFVLPLGVANQLILAGQPANLERTRQIHLVLVQVPAANRKLKVDLNVQA